MPPKLPKLSDKSSLAIRRLKRSEEQKAKKRKEMTEDQKEKQRKGDRESKARRRSAKKKPSRFVNIKSEVKKKYIQHEREFNRLYKVRMRSERTDAEHEYELISNLLCMRRLRRSLTDEEYESDKVRAKEGMRLAREKGFKMAHIRRVGRDIEEFDLWYWFARSGRPYMDILQAKKPEFAKEIEVILEKEHKESAEKAENEREEWRKGIWHYNVVMETYDWTGKEPPGEDNPHPDSGDFFLPRQCWPEEENLTEDEWKELELRWSEQENNDWNNYWKEERNKRARENHQKRKEALKEPIVMPDEPEELCEYEKIRERIIKERNDALAAAGFKWQPLCS